MHHNSTKVNVPPGGKTSISFGGGEPAESAVAKSPNHGPNRCQEERNQSHVFSVGSEGLGMHYNPYQGKRQQSNILFGEDDKVDVKSCIRTQPNAHQSHVFDGPEPTPQPKQAVPQPKQAIPQPSGGTKQEAAPQEPPAPSVSQKAPVPDKPVPQPAKKPAELQPKAVSKPVEEPQPRDHVKTSVHVLAPPGGSSSIVFG